MKLLPGRTRMMLFTMSGGICEYPSEKFFSNPCFARVALSVPPPSEMDPPILADGDQPPEKKGKASDKCPNGTAGSASHGEADRGQKVYNYLKTMD